METAAAPAAPAAPTAPATPASTTTPNSAPDVQGTPTTATPEARPERPKSKVGDVEWEQDEDGEWYSTQKVNGKEERISHQTALSAARQMAASTERFQAAKAIERNVETMLATAASSPRATVDFLTKMGVDVVDLAEQILGERIEESRLTPDQKRAREAERRLQEYEEREQERARAEYERRIEAHNQRSRQAYVQAFDQQLDALHAPKAEGARTWLYQRIAALVTHAEDNGIPTTLDAIVKRASADFQGMTGVKWGAPQQQAAPPKPAIRVPSPTEQPQGNPRDASNGRFVPRRDPKPQLIPGDSASVRAIAEWARRNPGR